MANFIKIYRVVSEKENHHYSKNKEIATSKNTLEGKQFFL